MIKKTVKVRPAKRPAKPKKRVTKIKRYFYKFETRYGTYEIFHAQIGMVAEFRSKTEALNYIKFANGIRP